MSKLIDYARDSTRQQSTDRQRAGLLAAGVRRDDLYVDQGVSGARASRPQFDQAFDALMEGDTLVITTLDRLGRSSQNMLAFSDELRSSGAGLRGLNLGGATSTQQPRWALCCSRSWPPLRRWNTRSSANASPTPSTSGERLAWALEVGPAGSLTARFRMLSGWLKVESRRPRLLGTWECPGRPSTDDHESLLTNREPFSTARPATKWCVVHLAPHSERKSLTVVNGLSPHP